MLILPEVGFEESVTKHNCSVAAACDWIEASLFAGEEEITQTQVSDILQEQGIYPKLDEQDLGRDDLQQFCTEFMAILWSELQRRADLLGTVAPFTVQGMRVKRKLNWEEGLPAAYLLMLSSALYYPSLRKLNKGKYVEQGELFEEFCLASLNGDGWCAARTGWSSRKGAQKLIATVAAAAEALDEPNINDAEVALDQQENEAGCDLVCYRPYKERWLGRPVILVQCASGDNFEGKLGTPSIDRWRNYIGFSTVPLRGFCTPRAFHRGEFRRHCAKVSGLLLDRYRLLEPFAHAGLKLPNDLQARLKSWLRPRIKVLPAMN